MRFRILWASEGITLAWSLRNSKGSFTKGVNEISHALRAILVMNRRKRPLYPYGQKRLEASALDEHKRSEV